MTDSGEVFPAAARLERWRELIATRLSRTIVVLSLGPLAWAFHDAERFGRTFATCWVAFGVVSGIGCALARVRARTRAWWLVLHLILLLLGATPLVGMTGGLAALVALTTLLGVLLLGTREAVGLLITMCAVMLGSLALVVAGVVDRPSLNASDAGLPSNALRIIFSTALVCTMILLASDYLVRRLIQTLLEAERSLESERAESKRRQQVEQELIRAQQLEALSRLAGGVAHDVNNNLMVALSCADIINRTPHDPAQVRKLCAAIQDACTNAASLTSQLLTLGRRDVSRPQAVAPLDVMRRIQRLLQSSLGRRVRLHVDAPEGLAQAHVDPRQLEQVLINLVINARDAMPKGGELRIFADRAEGAAPAYDFATAPEGPPGAVRIHVQDSGTGIEPGLLPQIMEPFFTTKGPEQGTGLGLAVARAFAEASGGRLCVQSRPGAGATFTLELPPAPEQPKAAARAPVAEPVGSISVLVVEDDPRVRLSIVSELSSAGYRVLEAEDGMAALDVARKERHIDLLCTDAVMPRLGAEDLIPRFTALHPQARVLVCSAYVRDEHLRQLLNSGHYDSLAKPFSSAELKEAVARALQTQAPELRPRTAPLTSEATSA